MRTLELDLEVGIAPRAYAWVARHVDARVGHEVIVEILPEGLFARGFVRSAVDGGVVLDDSRCVRFIGVVQGWALQRGGIGGPWLAFDSRHGLTCRRFADARVEPWSFWMGPPPPRVVPDDERSLWRLIPVRSNGQAAESVRFPLPRIAPVVEAPCPRCGGELHECDSGDPGCAHCDACGYVREP